MYGNIDLVIVRINRHQAKISFFFSTKTAPNTKIICNDQ